jgi:protein-disulfide isomerase
MAQARAKLDTVASIAVIVSAAVLLYTVLGPSCTIYKPNTSPLPKEPIDRTGAPVLGRADARAAIIVFSDFQCPYCARFAVDTLGPIKALYIDSGKVLLAFRHLPLETIHPLAMTAAVASNCAAAQGRFWDYHDALFRLGRLSDNSFDLLATTTGLDKHKFSVCYSRSDRDPMRRDTEIAEGLGISGTPAFLLAKAEGNGLWRVARILKGSQSVARFKAALDQLLAGI